MNWIHFQKWFARECCYTDTMIDGEIFCHKCNFTVLDINEFLFTSISVLKSIKNSAVKWLIVINRIQYKSFVYIICVCTVYKYYLYINKSISVRKMNMLIYIYNYMIYKYKYFIYKNNIFINICRHKCVFIYT